MLPNADQPNMIRSTSFDPIPWNPRVGWQGILTCGFGASVGLWALWFITHLPWLRLSEPVSLGILLGYWLLAAAVIGASVGRTQALRVGILSGVVTGLVGLLILGSKLSEVPASGTGEAGDLRPAAALIVAGFVVLGGVIGAIGGLAGAIVRGSATGFAVERGGWDGETAASAWSRRFAWVTAAGMVPLLLIGGLVTSTDAGMSVPDWPNTFGTNMFLYPLGPRAAPDVFLEHSHRLFGTLVGLSAIVLMVQVFVSDSRRWVRNWAVGLLLLVIAQGILGGMRVRIGTMLAIENTGTFDRWYAFAHGVLGQIVFAWGIALAAFLSASFREPLSEWPEAGRRIRAFATGAMHATILQLVFGAMYRHTRSTHPLWAHAAFALIVLVMATMAGFLTQRLTGSSRLERNLRRAGGVLAAIVVLQFTLGWVAFVAGGRQHDPETIGQALLRSSHQFNGALLLAVVTWMAMVVRRIPRKASGQAGAEGVGAGTGELRSSQAAAG